MTGPRRSSSCRSDLRLGAQRVVLELDRLRLRQHVVERAPPFGLEPLANRRATATKLGMAQLGVMQLVVVAL